mmetsp:Transcript_44320/g.125187  ORF Transcript_44320/g.125187 Transcript_44320/m.125187 type:complete len:112 (+) Transcript_44320:51-386(+)
MFVYSTGILSELQRAAPSFQMPSLVEEQAAATEAEAGGDIANEEENAEEQGHTDESANDAVRELARGLLDDWPGDAAPKTSRSSQEGHAAFNLRSPGGLHGRRESIGLETT